MFLLEVRCLKVTLLYMKVCLKLVVVGSMNVQEVEKSLEEARQEVHQLEQKLQAEQACRGVLRAKMAALVHVSSQFKSVFHRSMTRLVNYDQRLALLSGHVQSISGEVCACFMKK